MLLSAAKPTAASAPAHSVPGDCSSVLEAETSGRLSLQAAGIETTAAEVIQTETLRPHPDPRSLPPDVNQVRLGLTINRFLSVSQIINNQIRTQRPKNKKLHRLHQTNNRKLPDSLKTADRTTSPRCFGLRNIGSNVKKVFFSSSAKTFVQSTEIKPEETLTRSLRCGS